MTENTFDGAVKSASLAMVDFWAAWCGPCRLMSPIVEKLAALYDGKAVIGKVETNSEMELAQKYGITAIPTLIFFKNGVEFERKVGVVPEDALRKILDDNL